MTGGRDEVELLGFLIALEAGGHGGTSSLHPTLRKVAKDGAPELFGWTNKGGAPGICFCVLRGTPCGGYPLLNSLVAVS